MNTEFEQQAAEIAIIETIDNRWTERLARSLTVDRGCTAMVALYAMDGKMLKEAMVPGTIGLAEEFGGLVRKDAHTRIDADVPKNAEGAEAFGSATCPSWSMEIAAGTRGISVLIVWTLIEKSLVTALQCFAIERDTKTNAVRHRQNAALRHERTTLDDIVLVPTQQCLRRLTEPGDGGSNLQIRRGRDACVRAVEPDVDSKFLARGDEVSRTANPA